MTHDALVPQRSVLYVRLPALHGLTAHARSRNLDSEFAVGVSAVASVNVVHYRPLQTFCKIKYIQCYS